MALVSPTFWNQIKRHKTHIPSVLYSFATFNHFCAIHASGLAPRNPQDALTLLTLALLLRLGASLMTNPYAKGGQSRAAITPSKKERGREVGGGGHLQSSVIAEANFQCQAPSI